MKEDVRTNIDKYDFVLDSLGYADEPLEQRAFVFCKILRELNIPFKKHYTSPQHRHLRSMPYKEGNDFNNMGMVIVGNCDENYARYAIYLYEKKMNEIELLNKIFSL